MLRNNKWLLGLTLSLAAAGCMDAASSDDQGNLPPPLDAGGTTTPLPTLDSGTPAPTADASIAIDGAVQSLDGGAADASVDGGGTAPISLKGTGANCSTYGLKMGDMCSGKFCAVTAAQIDMALVKPRIGNCPLVTAEDACEGKLITAVGKCARSEKTKLENALKTTKELRPFVQACVYADTTAAVDQTKVPPACLGCYLDSAECAGDKCLTPCLAGDSKDCDACRETQGCNNAVAVCAGFPDPR